MKKVLLSIIIVLITIISYMIYSLTGTTYEKIISLNNQVIEIKNNKSNEDIEDASNYYVYRYDSLDKSFKSKDKAINYAKALNKAYIIENESKTWVWDNFKDFIVYSDNIYLKDFDSFSDAYIYAKNYTYGKITYKDNNYVLWERQYEPSENKLLHVQKIYQYPELPRGCEVTALTMLLNYFDIMVDKIELADEIDKVKGVYNINGTIYYGNPNKGFVGDMYNLNYFGLGVYVDPVYNLAQKYLPDTIINLTGLSFNELYTFIDKGSPIWVITNTSYKPLKDEFFTMWQTEFGYVNVTSKQHAVLVIGYDKDYIYVNDPLNKVEKIDKKNFIEAWEQLGSQAITAAPIK